MKRISAKTVDEAVELACKELNLAKEDLHYEVLEEKKGLFSKKATIGIPDIEDAISVAERYLNDYIAALGLKGEVESRISEDIIHITINCNKNPVLIGNKGSTLQALNELVRLAVRTELGLFYRILLDVAGYKEEKYDRLAYMAENTAREVLSTKIDVKLEPMPADERRIIHNTLSGREHLKTESIGEGARRAVVIKYVD
ncbi:MAG: Jag N-terminal domain-containing protein [Bacilli bacterium]|nr:Jag N-terminal domain-containing protein [Bacilli bacterium]